MIERARRYARRHGARALFTEAVKRLVAKLYSRSQLTIMAKDLDEIVELARPSDLRIEPLDRQHLAGLAELNRKRGAPDADARFLDNLNRGLHGFVGLRDGEIVGYYWWVGPERAASHPDLDWLGTVLRLDPGQAYGSDLYVLPEHRAGGTANAMLHATEVALRDLGYGTLKGYVEGGNASARWLYASRGYVPIAEAVCRKVLSRRTVTPVRMSA